jgi:hypothetical protein
LPEQSWFSSYLFPPLNDAYRLPALLTTGLVTVIIYSLADSPLVRSRKKRVLLQLAGLLLVIVGLSAFVVATERFVKTIERPGLGDKVTITVGYVRNDFATKTFGNMSDEEMLRQRGTTDEQVYELWERSSVIVARWTLLLSYILFLASAVAVLSLQVLYEVVGPATDS